MKKLAVLGLLAAMAPAFGPAQTMVKNWEEVCGVTSSSDDVRNMAVSASTNTLVTVNRLATGSNDLLLFNTADGTPATPAALDQTGIPTGTYSLVNVAVSDDGAIFACNLAHADPMLLTVYYWADASAAPVAIYTAPAWLGYRMGDAMDVRGSVSDNSVKVIVSGNNAASQPLVLTTADNGANWTPATLANTVQAQDIHLNADGTFYKTFYSSSTVPTLMNADGSATATTVPYVTTSTPAPAAYGAFAANDAQDTFFGVGIRNEAAIFVSDAAGNLIAQSPSDDLIDVDGTGAGNFTGLANGSCAIEIIPVAEDYEIYALSERNGVAKYTLDNPSASVTDWQLMGR
ncbi:MAG: trimeric autotransporter adhesin [Candidatus Sumerlaeota bacterium]|nr:trimeric autotransporter adhesin [Candidatus Sumerlaeota bacterium]